MKTNLLKKGRAAVAIAVSLAMVFATVSFPASVAKAVDADPLMPVVTELGEKMEGSDLTGTYELPEGYNFVYIKQANDSNVLWTLGDFSSIWGPTIDIGVDTNPDPKIFEGDGPDFQAFKDFFGEHWDKLVPASDLKDASIDYVYGIGTFGPYEFSEEEGVITFTYDTEKVSHFYAGRYEVPEKEYGEITVTKEVQVLTDDETIKVNKDFYVTLFHGEMHIIETKMITIVNSEANSVVFEDLDLDETYMVYETDSEGNVIDPDEDLPMGDWVNIIYSSQSVELTSGEQGVKTGTVTVTNVFDPEDLPLLGSIKVHKTTTTTDGKLIKTNKTFYVALFEDEALTKLVSDVMALEMKGNSTAEVVFLTDKDDNPLEAGTAYYVAETDKDGVPISDSMAQLGCEIEFLPGTGVVVSEDKDMASVEITGEDEVLVKLVNKFKEEGGPLTGDDSNMNLWLFLALLGVAGAIAPFAFRKKEVQD